MNKLAKWNPFKFKRKDKSKDKGDSTHAVPVHHAGPSEVQPASRLLEAMMSPSRLWRDPFALLNEMDGFFGDFSPRTFNPSVDVVDEGKHVRVTAELPGLSSDDIDVTVQDGYMTLSGEKQSESEVDEEGCYRVERYFGSFHRAIPLPTDVDTDAAQAKFENGVLSVRFPKLEDEKPGRRIKID